MKTILGILMVITGIFIGLYLGIWWAFIGGIVVVVEAINADEMVAMDLAIGIARIIFAGLVGQLAAIILVFPGMALILIDQ